MIIRNHPLERLDIVAIVIIVSVLALMIVSTIVSGSGTVWPIYGPGIICILAVIRYRASNAERPRKREPSRRA